LTTSPVFAVGWAISSPEEFTATTWVTWPLGRARLSANEIALWIPSPFSMLGPPLTIGRGEIASYEVREEVLEFVKLEVAGPMHQVSFACLRRHGPAVRAWLAGSPRR
jgi:hypothetical protein